MPYRTPSAAANGVRVAYSTATASTDTAAITTSCPRRYVPSSRRTLRAARIARARHPDGTNSASRMDSRFQSRR